MGDLITVDLDSDEVEKKLKKLKKIQNGTNIALTRSLNRALAGMRTDAGKESAKRYHIKAGDIKEKVNSYRANYSNLSVKLSSKGRPVRLAKYKYAANVSPGRAGGAAAFVQVKKGKSGGFINGSGGRSKGFVATMKNGCVGIFQRVRKQAGYKGGLRAPIEQKYSVGAVQILQNEEISTVIQENAVTRFNKELDHQVEYLLSQN